MILSIALVWLTILGICWLGWQLLRQNGRILLRLDELENRLIELEFGVADDPDGLRPGAEAPALAAGGSEMQSATFDLGQKPGSPAAGNGVGRETRFSNRSVARSKIKRNGLKAGTRAPDFRLPRLDGRGDLSLADFRGRRVLLVFSSPHCGPCNTLAPELEKFHREQERDRSPVAADRNARGAAGVIEQPQEAAAAAVRDRSRFGQISVVMISKGEPKENRAKVKEHGLTFPIVLQQQWEISRRYAMFATPIAYLIDEQGSIVHDVAVGTDKILELMATTDGQV